MRDKIQESVEEPGEEHKKIISPGKLIPSEILELRKDLKALFKRIAQEDFEENCTRSADAIERRINLILEQVQYLNDTTDGLLKQTQVYLAQIKKEFLEPDLNQSSVSQSTLSDSMTRSKLLDTKANEKTNRITISITDEQSVSTVSSSSSSLSSSSRASFSSTTVSAPVKVDKEHIMSKAISDHDLDTVNQPLEAKTAFNLKATDKDGNTLLIAVTREVPTGELNEVDKDKEEYKDDNTPEDIEKAHNIIKALITQGVDKDAPNHHGLNALCYAGLEKLPNVPALLLDLGVDGDTALRLLPAKITANHTGADTAGNTIIDYIKAKSDLEKILAKRQVQHDVNIKVITPSVASPSPLSSAPLTDKPTVLSTNAEIKFTLPLTTTHATENTAQIHTPLPVSTHGDSPTLLSPSHSSASLFRHALPLASTAPASMPLSLIFNKTAGWEILKILRRTSQSGVLLWSHAQEVDTLRLILNHSEHGPRQYHLTYLTSGRWVIWGKTGTCTYYYYPSLNERTDVFSSNAQTTLLPFITEQLPTLAKLCQFSELPTLLCPEDIASAFCSTTDVTISQPTIATT